MIGSVIDALGNAFTLIVVDVVVGVTLLVALSTPSVVEIVPILTICIVCVDVVVLKLAVTSQPIVVEIVVNVPLIVPITLVTPPTSSITSNE